MPNLIVLVVSWAQRARFGGEDILHANAVAGAYGKRFDSIESVILKGFVTQPSLRCKVIWPAKVLWVMVQRPHVILDQCLFPVKEKSVQEHLHSCAL